MKLFWEVQPVPTGRYRSFERRGWPIGYADKDKNDIAVALSCEDDYIPSNVKEGKHGEIQIRVAVYNEKFIGFDWKRLKKRAATLEEAKKLAEEFFSRNPELLKNKEL